jgi:Protein of unknown function (DUF4238)
MPAKKRRHHVVPQWYLRGFADEQKNLLEWPVDGRPPTLRSVRGVAWAPHFYAADLSAPDDDFEDALSELESDAAPVGRRLQDGILPTGDDRKVMALYIAAQMVRTPMYRNMLARQFASMLGDDHPIRVAQVGLRGRAVLETVFPGDSFDAVRADVLQMMWFQMQHIASSLYARGWQLTMFDAPVLFTSDHPVSIWDDAPNFHVSGTSALTAREVRWPISRTTALVMGPLGGPSGIVRGTPWLAHQLNLGSLMWFEEYVYDHPQGIIRQLDPSLLRRAFLEKGVDLTTEPPGWKALRDALWAATGNPPVTHAPPA